MRALVLAPHLKYLPADAGDVSIVNLWSALSTHVSYVDIVGNSTVRRYRRGGIVAQYSFCNRERSQVVAGLRTVFRKSHYLKERFLTRPFVQVVRQCLSDSQYDILVCDWLATADALRDTDTKATVCCIYTENDEFAWFQNLRRSTRDPARKLVAYISEQWAKDFLRKNSSKFTFIHISSTDYRGYEDRFPDHKAVVIPAGTRLHYGPSWNDRREPSSQLRLLFVGWLGSQNNWDALRYFRDHFYGALRTAVRSLQVTVAGSDPSSQVRRLCEKMGWELKANVSNDALQELYESTTFAILPFRYGTGRKRKLLEAVSRGVPFLATSAATVSDDELPPFCLRSDDPLEWVRQVLDVMGRGLNADDRRRIVNHAIPYSWDRLAATMLRALEGEFRTLHSPGAGPP